MIEAGVPVLDVRQVLPYVVGSHTVVLGVGERSVS
jgi:hypothetical protein